MKKGFWLGMAAAVLFSAGAWAQVPPAPAPPLPTASPTPTPLAPPAPAAAPVRVRDVARMGGTNSNPLIGYGLVVGLQGTGDSPGSVSQEMLTRMLGNLGMAVPAGSKNPIKLKNVAIVMVTADMPAFTRAGDSMDITVSSLGDATSLEGGVLMLSLLRAADGQVYANAQGQVQVSHPAAGPAGVPAPPTKAHLNVGQIARGGLASRDVPMTTARLDSLSWIMNRPDFEMAARVASAINARFGPGSATARDAATVDVSMSAAAAGGSAVDLVAQMGGLLLPQGPVMARVVVDARSGAIVTGGSIRLTRGQASYRGWRIEVADAPQVTVDEVAGNLQRLGLSPKEEIAVLQSLRRASVLSADIDIQ